MTDRSEAPAICNSMYSFHRMVEAGQLDVFGFPALCAELGIRLLEVSPTYLPASESDMERLKEIIRDAGCSVTQMTCDFPLCTTDEGERAARVDDVRRWADVARGMGASTIRCNLGRPLDKEPERGIAQVIRSFKEIVSFCESWRLVAVIENTHGPSTGDADTILEILSGVGSSALGTCPDFGNFREEVRYESLARLMPYAAHLHAKTWKLNAAGDESTYDFPRCVQIAKDAGYAGAWGIEFEAELDDVVTGEKTGVRMTRELLERLL